MDLSSNGFVFLDEQDSVFSLPCADFPVKYGTSSETSAVLLPKLKKDFEMARGLATRSKFR